MAELSQRVTVKRVIACVFKQGQKHPLIEPVHYKGDLTTKPRYGMSVIFRKDNPEELAKFEDVKKKAQVIIKAAVSNLTKDRYESFAKPWLDGATQNPDVYPPTYLNSWILRINRAESLGPPTVRDPYDKTKELSEEDIRRNLIHGCLCSVSFDIYYDGTHGAPRVCAGLVAVQYGGKGIDLPIAGSSFDDDEFDEYEPEEFDGEEPGATEGDSTSNIYDEAW